MPLNTQHTGKFSTLPFIFLKGGNILLLAVVLLFFVSQGFASEQDAQQVYTSGDNTIVYKATETGNVVITEGTITAIEGKTIRLLPGTHIKSSEQLTVNIASKACQEAVAKEVSKAKEEEMLTFAAIKRNEVNPEPNNDLKVPFGFCGLPAKNNTINQQRTELVAYLGISSFSFNSPVLYLLRSNNKSFITHNSQLTTRLAYLPVTSWGNCAENIKVMRC
jgi:hypothetical protein